MTRITNLHLGIMTISIALLATGAISDAFAMPQVRLTEGTGGSALITDQVLVGDADENVNEGIIAYTQNIGVFDFINFEVGITKPNAGSATMPDMDFFVITSSSAPGTLKAEFTDVGFMNEKVRCISIGGGTTHFTTTYTVYMDPSNTPFGQAQQLFTTTQVPGPGSPIVFDIDANAVFAASPDATYSLTMVAEIEHDEVGDNTSFDIGLVCSSLVAGELLPLDNTALFLAGIQSMTVWMIPAVAGLAGAGIYLVKYKANRD